MVIEFFIIALVVALAAGPVINWVAQASAQQGKITALFGVCGIGIGLCLVAILCGAVVYALKQVQWMTENLHWIAAAYLFYLAWFALRYTPPALRTMANSRFAVLGEGVKQTIKDPAVYLFFLTVMPLFITRSKPLYMELMVLDVLCIGIAAKVNGAVALVGSHALNVLADRKHLAIIRTACSLSLALSGVVLLLKTSSPQ